MLRRQGLFVLILFWLFISVGVVMMAKTHHGHVSCGLGSLLGKVKLSGHMVVPPFISTGISPIPRVPFLGPTVAGMPGEV